jgi:uncharacterized protein (UPF0332 family)
MNPRDFLTQAQRLVALTGEEDWRSAVSRAYYSAFHVAREFMESLGFTVPQADRAHGYLWLRLQNCGEASLEQLGRDLQDLRRQRNYADYDLNRTYRQSDAQRQVGRAAGMILLLAAVVEPMRTQVMDTMKEYERVVLQVVTWHP